MKRLVCAVALLALAGCASVSKIESGDQDLGERLVVHLDGAWNQVSAPSMGPARIWTMEGLPIDRLMIYSGLKDGEAVHAETGGSGSKTFRFRSTMQPDQLVALFEGMLTRDKSQFTLRKLEPSSFGGKGIRFEYSLLRKVDNVQLSGVGYACVSKGELFAILYQAPRLTFFSRNQDRVDHMARAARLKM
jgi:hypothetical protein